PRSRVWARNLFGQRPTCTRDDKPKVWRHACSGVSNGEAFGKSKAFARRAKSVTATEELGRFLRSQDSLFFLK
ncbi:MAG TPA: hypothetical protein VI895_12920, partial [Bdellovibrionota bacterium]|nr:hypothetical protein [Bdellovibrionota bacterium]